MELRTLRVCIYTAIYGAFDTLKPQPAQTVPADFICFTDTHGLGPVAPWHIVVRRHRLGNHPRMQAKYYKILSHRVFPGGRPRLTETFPFGLWRQLSRYDYLIWIDGSARIKEPHFAESVIAQIRDTGWAMFAHPKRQCIYDEAVVCAGLKKCENQPVIEQTEHYRTEGYPANNGLKAAGVIARDARRTDLAAVNEMWWRENLRWSYQDQLSLPVVLWRLGKGSDCIKGDLWRNDLVEWQRHNNWT